MEMVDRYLYEVSRRLPIKQRKDIEDELRSIILDNLEDRTDGEPTKEDIEAVLLELGPPAQVAESYRGTPRFLIGPELFDLYLMVVKILVAVSIGGLFIAHVTGLFFGDFTGSEMMERTWQFVLNALGSAVTSVGWVTIIFASIQFSKRNLKEANIMKDETWHPSDLPAVPKKEERIKPFETAIGITITVILLTIFSLFPEKVGIYYMVDGVWNMIPLFSPEAMALYVPMWSVLWILDIAQKIWLLRDNQWKKEIHIFDIVISVIKIGVLIYMIKGPVLFSNELLSATFLPELSSLLSYLPTVFNILFGLAIIGSIFNIVSKSIKLLRIKLN